MPTDISRRGLLQGAALLAVGASQPAPTLAAQQSARQSARKANWAVLGLGNFAGLVLPRFARSQHANLAALISGTPEKLVRIGEQYGVPASARYGYDDWDRIRNDPRIDIIYVITPVGTHADFAIESLRAGKHVFVEKTMAESPARASAMLDAAAKARRTLGVAYRVWHDPANRLLMDLSRRGELGRLTSVMAHKGTVMQLPAGNWRFQRPLAGGGALVDLGIYSVQACRYVAGEEPVEVQATAFSDHRDSRYRDVEQTIAWMMRFPSGVLASCSASWDYTGQNIIRAAFQEGQVTLDPATLGMNNRMFIGRQRNGAYSVEEQPLASVDQLVAQLDHFSLAVLAGSPPMTDGVEGLRDLLAIEAIYRSVSSGRPEPVGRVTGMAMEPA